MIRELKERINGLTLVSNYAFDYASWINCMRKEVMYVTINEWLVKVDDCGKLVVCLHPFKGIGIICKWICMKCDMLCILDGKNENAWYGIVNKSMMNIIEYMDDDMMIIGRVFE